MMEGSDDIKSIEQAYSDNFDRIYKFFYYKTLSRDTAEDLTSETFLALATILRSQKEISNFKAFVYGIAKNIFLQYLKKKYKQEISFSTISEDFEEFAVSYVNEVEEKVTLEERLQKFLSFIPEKQRVILQLRFIEKLTLSEICKKLGKDMNYVKTTQKRALKSLRNYVELYGTKTAN